MSGNHIKSMDKLVPLIAFLGVFTLFLPSSVNALMYQDAEIEAFSNFTTNAIQGYDEDWTTGAVCVVGSGDCWSLENFSYPVGNSWVVARVEWKRVGGATNQLYLYNDSTGWEMVKAQGVCGDPCNTTVNVTLNRTLHEIDGKLMFAVYVPLVDPNNQKYYEMRLEYTNASYEYDFQVGVFSSSEIYNDSSCPLVLNDSVVTFAGIEQDNATTRLAQCCYSNVWHDCWVYNFTDVSEGTYDLTVTKEGYATYTQSIILDQDNMYMNVFLDKPTQAGLTITVTDSEGATPNARVQLYYANGTLYESTHYPYDMNPVIFRGSYTWQQIPKDNYYFIIESQGYEMYRSPVFNLGEGRTFTVILEGTDISLNISTPVYESISANDDINFTINATGFLFPIYDAHYWIRNDYGELPYLIHIPHQNYNFSIDTDDYFTGGENIIYVESKKGIISNYLTITVDVRTSEEAMNDPMIDLGFKELGWVGVLFAPFSLITMFLVGIGAYFENMVKGSGGKIFITTIMIGVLSFTYLGLYPAWVGILIVILCGAILAKFVMGLGK